MKSLCFDVVKEDMPGEKFSQTFEKNWSAYKAWYLDEGESARPTYLECIEAFKTYMPELFPLYEKILQLLECDDLQARFISLYNPPSFYTGCSQLILEKPRKALVRNYDFPPHLCEGVIMQTHWLAKRVIAMTDCMWGVLDGINDSGLAVSLSYGGRFVRGNGFGITIILRYVLETCATVDEATAALRRIPVHLDYNVALLDKSGQFATLFIAPDTDVYVSQERGSTNHQGHINNRKYHYLSDSIVRLEALHALEVAGSSTPEYVAQQFLIPPLYRPHKNFDSGTLYTAAYYPETGVANYLWPQKELKLTFNSSEEQNFYIHYE